MNRITVERVGGIAGLGGSMARIKSMGEIDLEKLPENDQKKIVGLFRSPPKANSTMRDGFRYRLSIRSEKGVEQIEIDEGHVPPVVAGCVRDELFRLKLMR